MWIWVWTCVDTGHQSHQQHQSHVSVSIVDMGWTHRRGKGVGAWGRAHTGEEQRAGVSMGCEHGCELGTVVIRRIAASAEGAAMGRAICVN